MKNVRFLGAIVLASLPVALIVFVAGGTKSEDTIKIVKDMKRAELQLAVDSMVLVKHTNGLCFGIFEGRGVTASGGVSMTSATEVPCDKAFPKK